MCDRDPRSIWSKAKLPLRVPVHTVPDRFLHLVLQVENCLEPGGCMWLHAADVRSNALQRLNKTRERKSQLAEWQVAEFEGMEEAKGT